MDKNKAAFGGFYVAEGDQLVAEPESFEAAYAKVSEIIDSYEVGAPISADDLAILRTYLPYIGADETELAYDSTYQGRGSLDIEKEEGGIQVALAAKLGCEAMWEHTRRLWTGSASIQKLGGARRIIGVNFKFNFVSFGVGETGDWIILHKITEGRKFDGEAVQAQLIAGDKIFGSRFETSKGNQWGFFMQAIVDVDTEVGTIVF